MSWDDQYGFWLDGSEYPEQEHDEDVYWEFVYFERDEDEE